MNPVDFFDLKLYVVGNAARSQLAIRNLRSICGQYLPGRHRIEIIDLATDARRASADRIVAIPTLVRALPEPLQRIVGDLADPGLVLAGLEIDRHDDV